MINGDGRANGEADAIDMREDRKREDQNAADGDSMVENSLAEKPDIKMPKDG